MFELLKEIADRSGGLTYEDAKRLCGMISYEQYTVPCGYSRTENHKFIELLCKVFPDFHWRIILDRSGERTRFALTIDDEDSREHYFNRLGGQCVHCGKSAREISRIDEVNGDDEFLHELEIKMENERALQKRT